MSISLDGTNGITFPNSSTQTVGAVGASSQTWTDVTSSRAMGTTYTNSTGKPIEVLITLNGSGPGARHDIYINSVNIGQCYSTDYYSSTAATSHYQLANFTVPNGATYSDNVGQGSPSILQWCELR